MPLTSNPSRLRQSSAMEGASFSHIFEPSMERGDESSCSENRKKKLRKYNESYLSFGFTSTVINGEERPQCVLCLKILAPGSMVPNKLKRHLEANHPNSVNEPLDVFVKKLEEMTTQNYIVPAATSSSTPKSALMASYMIAYQVAKHGEPRSSAEEFILPAIIDVVNTMFGESDAEKLRTVPVSEGMIGWRHHSIAADLKEQLIEKLRTSEFSLQLDEAIDGNLDTHLICYVRYVDGQSTLEDLLLCKNITNVEEARDLFTILDTFMLENSLAWSDCVGICTDGARLMSGSYGGLQALVREKAPRLVWNNCIFHRDVFEPEYLSPGLSHVLETTMETLNYIKSRPSKAGFFSELCEDRGAEGASLLHYCEAQWLWRGNVLLRTFKLRHEILTFLHEERNELAHNFADPDFLVKLAYLCDIFGKLNFLNTSLKKPQLHILHMAQKLRAFRMKLELWKRAFSEESVTECFPLLHEFCNLNQIFLSNTSKSVYIDHLCKLYEWSKEYFSEDRFKGVEWIQDPFTARGPVGLDWCEEESLIDLCYDFEQKVRFSSMQLVDFWMSLKDEYPLLSAKALRILVPFAASYLCEAGFTAAAHVKSKFRSKIILEHELRIAVSGLTPRFEKLCGEPPALLPY